ncbi:alginate export family protein [Geobacter sulfurreducens]|uniref:Alginate export domain-containing protein n=2 Tax=Geobacter sulfurreducens TaxID=35554 RepID=Q74F08_GEOSL|nr:hypothetical protein GSU0801 [Geobacter sulfurreducens PCA]UAC04865.1 alginate export family protein [Geobacter sulfurreducens]UTG93491.1 alginate export family protein [Geobacter sulfurreducens]HCD96859.1 alginate export family protein [Geobacter sulfurreducens]
MKMPRSGRTLMFHAAALALAMAPVAAAAAAGENGGDGKGRRYQLCRFDEDWSYLRAPSRRDDLWDPVKYLPLTSSGDAYLSLGGDARLRYEYFNNANWGRGPQDNDGYLLQRYLVHADLRLTDAARLFAQLQSSLEEGRSGGPRPTDEDQLDLHQLFVDATPAVGDTRPLTVRVGRQELTFGSSRLVSVRESPNNRRSFDGVRIIGRVAGMRLDAFATRPVETKPHVFDNRSDDAQAFWGAYGVAPLPVLPGGSIDLYYLGLYRRGARFDQGRARETRHAGGTRIWGAAGAWDYNAEFVFQWGSFGNGRIRAWTAASDTGYTLRNAPWQPRLGLRANIASGDSDPTDRTLGTFNPFYPKGNYFSEAGLMGPANLMNLHPEITVKPARNLSMRLDWDVIWRHSRHDGIYANSLSVVRSGTTGGSRSVGSQLQCQVDWQVDRHLLLTANYSRFFAGPFIRESGPGKDVDYVGTWATYRF